MPEIKDYSVVLSPMVSEKSTRLSPFRQYMFVVKPNSNKVQIARAIEKLYNVKVENVTTMTVKGKVKRMRGNIAGRTSSWKKAIVTLKSGFEIKLA